MKTLLAATVIPLMISVGTICMLQPTTVELRGDFSMVASFPSSSSSSSLLYGFDLGFSPPKPSTNTPGRITRRTSSTTSTMTRDYSRTTSSPVSGSASGSGGESTAFQLPLSVQAYPPAPFNDRSDESPVVLDDTPATLPSEFRLTRFVDSTDGSSSSSGVAMSSVLSHPFQHLRRLMGLEQQQQLPKKGGNETQRQQVYTTKKNVAFPTPRFQCSGKLYDEYTKKAMAMIQRKLQLEPNSQWGRRPAMVPFPPPPPSLSDNNNNNNTSVERAILIMGNSHTRQVATALEWQYQDEINGYEWKDGYTLEERFGRTSTDSTVATTTTTVYELFNHPAVYSPQWQRLLEEDVLQRTLDSFDAIVMGTFNVYDPKKNKKSALNKGIVSYYVAKRKRQQLRLGGGLAGSSILFETNKRSAGFDLKDLLEIYKGPVISLTGFGKAQQSQYQKIVATMLQAGRPNQLRLVNSRLPIEAVGGGNCGHHGIDPVNVVGECLNENDNHRCTGSKGGIADFVAWDVIEALYDVLKA